MSQVTLSQKHLSELTTPRCTVSWFAKTECLSSDISLFTNSALWAEKSGLVVTESVCLSVYLFVCLSPSHAIFLKPLIGSQIT